MILADKIIELRKKNGWSQEELAEKMEVSRQSISKWEGAQSVPDMNRIIRMSEIFGVSTDYLLKDEMETDAVRGNDPLPVDTGVSSRQVSMEEAVSFLDHNDTGARKVALGVMMCILSPIAIILLSGAQEAGRIAMTEGQATGLGLLPLILLIGGAVALFVMTGLKGSRYEYLEKEMIETSYGVDGMVRERRERYRGTYTAQMVTGIVLCVLAAVPLFIAMIFVKDDNSPEGEFIYCIAVGALLLFVAIGVLMIVRASCIWGGFQKLLEEGDYTREQKLENHRNETLTTIYWCAVTAGFLAYSFITMRWDRSWIVWPVAGVVFGLVTAVAKSLRKKN